MKYEDINKLLTNTKLGPSKWELDNVIWWDRTTNPASLIDFLERVKTLKERVDSISQSESLELENLLELLDDLDEEECKELLDRTDDESRDYFIENLARTSAIEVLTNGKMDKETMNTACKLSPNDFIMCAKRTQDLINAIQGLVIKGENLSRDIAGA